LAGTLQTGLTQKLTDIPLQAQNSSVPQVVLNRDCWSLTHWTDFIWFILL